MITSKERAKLRAQANELQPIFQLGKEGITPNFIEGVDQALENRELIKISLLENCELDVREACNTVSERTKAEQIQCIGRRFVLYRKSKKKDAKK